MVRDELTYRVTYRYLGLDEIMRAFAVRPPIQHVVITAHRAHDDPIEAADQVSAIRDVKHACHADARAQPEIDR